VGGSLASGRPGPDPRTPRDATFAEQVRAVADLLTRPLAAHEVVLRLDELTSLQPRPRRVPTRPAQPNRPVQIEHEYRRAGAPHLFAAFDTRAGRVYGVPTRRKRQVEYLTLLPSSRLSSSSSPRGTRSLIPSAGPPAPSRRSSPRSRMLSPLPPNHSDICGNQY